MTHTVLFSNCRNSIPDMENSLFLKTFDPVHTQSVEDVYAMAVEKAIAIAVIDAEFQVAEGMRLLEKIAANNLPTAIIMLFSADQIEFGINALERGASDFLLKPTTAHALDVVLQRAWNRFSGHAWDSAAGLIDSERLKAVSSIVENLSAFITNIARDVKSEVKYLNEMPCFVSVHNRELKIVSTNQLYRDRLGTKTGGNSWEVYESDQATPDKCPVALTFKTGKGVRSEAEVKCVNGINRPVIVHSAPIKNKRNEVVLVVEMAADIRAVKNLSDRLKETTQKYQQLFDEAPCYIYVIDKDYRLTETNRRFKEDFGDKIGSHCYMVYKDKKEPCARCPIKKIWDTGDYHHGEMTTASKDGETIDLVLWSSPIRNADNDITHVMVMGTNVTQIHRLQDHLTSLGLMIGSVSHGVKGLLTGLDAGMYLMDSGLKSQDQDRITEGFDVLKLMADRIRHLVLDILYYAKERNLNWEAIDVYTFAEGVSKTLGLKVRNKHIRFQTQFDKALGNFEIDAGIVHSALINILENAIDACTSDNSKDSHTIDFKASQEGDIIVFDITDNGAGMEEKTKKNLFNIFFSSKGSKGTGLGLFISNKIIQQHGGSITVESSPGRGSRFRIVIPKRLPEHIKQQNLDSLST